eukprot:CAMPEP_0170315634 /NCGR_PEP_ID=MMETSP0116_2-20130129/58425_1 /TAXON_ID=400756 /ORGANISM="Durinskia baltica, Strain CSIRO CS-38" /LENGTH=47 /DNA_ID= /DNA_START= /DNA_END= /DNA_ORIENTATION=
MTSPSASARRGTPRVAKRRGTPPRDSQMPWTALHVRSSRDDGAAQAR